MDWSSIPTILQQIKQSPLHNIPNFLCHILENKREEYEAAAAIKTLPGTHLILDSLLCVSQPTVTKWALSISQDLLRQEIIQASDVESGLHFGASSACSVDLTEFDLQRIAETFEITAPFTWNLVKIVMVHLIHFVRTPLTISDHLRLCPPTLRIHSDTHCISSHNHATPVTGLNSDQCLISLDFVPMSRATTYLSFSPYAAFA